MYSFVDASAVDDCRRDLVSPKNRTISHRISRETDHTGNTAFTLPYSSLRKGANTAKCHHMRLHASLNSRRGLRGNSFDASP